MFLYKLDNRLVLVEYIVINEEVTDYIVLSSGDVISKRFKKPLKPSKCREDYMQVKLCNKYNGEKTYLLHRLVAKAFIPNPENKPEVNHIDGNKSHNFIDNLEWVTREENIQHAYRLHLKEGLKGEQHPNSTTTELQAHNICQLLEANRLSVIEIADKCNVSKDVVRAILKHKIWNHISKLYKIDNYSVDGRFLYYSTEIIMFICKSLEENKLTRKEIAIKSGVSTSTVNNILRGKTYKHISSQYNISNYTIDKDINLTIRNDPKYDRMKQLISEGYSNNEIISILNLQKNNKTKNDLATCRRILKAMIIAHE